MTSSQQAILGRYQTAALADIQRGIYEPFVWPYRALGPNLVILYLLIPPNESKGVYLLRYPLILFVIWHAIDGLIWCKSSYVTVGYGIGLLNAWSIVWAATLLLFNDARSDFRRIEAAGELETTGLESTKELGHAPRGDAQLGGNATLDQEGLRRRHEHDEFESKTSNTITANGGLGATLKYDRASPRTGEDSSTNHESRTSYHWQGFPPSALHRLDWVADLVSSFRSPRWAHRIPPLPPPPLSVQRSLDQHSPVKSFKPPVSESDLTPRSLLRQNLPELLILYLVLDILKHITNQDPYFLGIPFPHFPFQTRLLLCLIFTYTALSAIFVLSPLVFSCLLGEARIGAHAWSWQYSPCFGNPRAITQRGLEGAWGLWWQQLFRFGFQEWGDGIARLLDGRALSRRHDFWGNQLSHGDEESEHEGGWGRKTEKGKLLRAAVAFGISAVLHACASFTALGPGTKPLTGSAAFFAVQPLGFIIQTFLKRALKRQSWAERCPWWATEAAYLLFVVSWFTLTGPLIADDFAKTGIWLFEPVPLSMTRGLKGEGWWRWGGRWMSWHTDKKHWWKSGVVF